MHMPRYTRFLITCLVSATVVYFALVTSQRVYAASYTAYVTGYAFASTSASGFPMVQGRFANHPPGTICNGSRDWSGDWPWGTRITMIYPITLRNSSNSAYTRSDFYLYDNGDPTCSKGMNWVDIYFGSYKQNPTVNCTCPGVSPTSCTAGTNNVNNCTDATNFGSPLRNYTQP